MRTSRGALTARIAALLTAVLTVASCGGPPSTHVADPAGTSRTRASAAQQVAAQMNGPFKVVAGGPGTPPVTWVFTPCGDGCAEVELGGDGSSQRATARYIRMQWTIDVHSAAALQCGDGTFAPGIAHYSWNPDTLEGRYWSTSDSRPCGSTQPFDTNPVPLTLTKAGA